MLETDVLFNLDDDDDDDDLTHRPQVSPSDRGRSELNILCNYRKL